MLSATIGTMELFMHVTLGANQNIGDMVPEHPVNGRRGGIGS